MRGGPPIAGSPTRVRSDGYASYLRGRSQAGPNSSSASWRWGLACADEGRPPDGVAADGDAWPRPSRLGCDAGGRSGPVGGMGAGRSYTLDGGADAAADGAYGSSSSSMELEPYEPASRSAALPASPRESVP